MRTINHQEIGGGFTHTRNIIIDTCQLSENEFETMVLINEEEVDCITSITESEAITAFHSLIQKYAEPLQKSVYSAKLIPGSKYTLAYYNEFGFPVTQKIKFNSLQLTSYAQYSDCVRLIFTPYRKRTIHEKNFYGTSLLIFEGWQDLPENFGFTLESETADCTMRKSNYSCFDNRYIDDLEKALKNPVVVYKNYKTDINGKIYAQNSGIHMIKIDMWYGSKITQRYKQQPAPQRHDKEGMQFDVFQQRKLAE